MWDVTGIVFTGFFLHGAMDLLMIKSFGVQGVSWEFLHLTGAFMASFLL